MRSQTQPLFIHAAGAGVIQCAIKNRNRRLAATSITLAIETPLHEQPIPEEMPTPPPPNPPAQ